jgi:predicted RNase H-like nuclease
VSAIATATSPRASFSSIRAGRSTGAAPSSPRRRGTCSPPPATTHASAPSSRRSVRRNPAAKSLSAQAAGIVAKIAEVDEFVRARRDSEQWLFECHPELSFWVLGDGSHLRAKHTAAGVVARLALVRAEFPDAEDQLAGAPWDSRTATLSDMLDAYAALTTALACARGDEEEHGGGERDDEGLLMRITV